MRITSDGLKARPHLTQVDVLSTVQRITGDGLEDANETNSHQQLQHWHGVRIKNIDYS